MKFDELNDKMRCFETTYDFCIPPELFMVARIDGRSFSRLTKKTLPFDVPFDVGFRDHMVFTVRHLMNCGFRVIYGYTQSDEISLLLHKEETLFDRKLRKYTSVLAGEASGAFSLQLGRAVSFDCRISVLPSDDLVVDYFRWRQEDAYRNALNAHSYWALRKKGHGGAQATEGLRGLTSEAKKQLLRSHDIDFQGLPEWQKCGIGVYSQIVPKRGENPLTGETAIAERKQLMIDLELPRGEAYGELIRSLIQGLPLIVAETASPAPARSSVHSGSADPSGTG